MGMAAVAGITPSAASASASAASTSSMAWSRASTEKLRERSAVSDIEEHRFSWSLEHHIEAIPVRAVGPGDERRAPSLRHQREHGVFPICGVVLEVHPGGEPRE